MTNRTFFGGKKPSNFYMNKKQVEKMYFNDQLIYQLTGIEVSQHLISVNTNSGKIILDMKEYFKLTSNMSFANVTWSLKDIEGELGSINSMGILTIPYQTIAVGEVTVTHGNMSATITVQAVRAAIVCTDLTLNTNSISMDMSNEINRNIIANVTPSNTTDEIFWKSSSTSVVTVDTKGCITAKSPGTATITATCGDKIASCQVTIVASCKDITLSKSAYTLDIGGTSSVTFTPAITPSNTTDSITWKSSSTSVVSVTATSGGKKGTIFAKSPGTAVVTVTCGSKSAQINITVTNSCTGIELDGSFSLNAGEGRSIGHVVYPSNCTDTVTWKSSNNSIVTVTDYGYVKAISPGTATITATCGSKSDSCDVTVIAVPSIGIQLSESEISLRPGASKQITVSLLPSNTTDDISKMVVNSSNSKHVPYATSKVDSRTMNVTITLIGNEPGVINFIYGSYNISCHVLITV